MLVEGGATLAAGLLAAGLIDRVALFVAPLCSATGPGVFAGWAAASLADAPAAVHLEARPVGPDILLVASFGRYEVFTGIVVELGTVVQRRAEPGAGGAADGAPTPPSATRSRSRAAA